MFVRAAPPLTLALLTACATTPFDPTPSPLLDERPDLTGWADNRTGALSDPGLCPYPTPPARRLAPDAPVGATYPTEAGGVVIVRVHEAPPAPAPDAPAIVPPQVGPRRYVDFRGPGATRTRGPAPRPDPQGPSAPPDASPAPAPAPDAALPGIADLDVTRPAPTPTATPAPTYTLAVPTKTPPPRWLRPGPQPELRRPVAPADSGLFGGSGSGSGASTDHDRSSSGSTSPKARSGQSSSSTAAPRATSTHRVSIPSVTQGIHTRTVSSGGPSKTFRK